MRYTLYLGPRGDSTTTYSVERQRSVQYAHGPQTPRFSGRERSGHVEEEAAVRRQCRAQTAPVETRPGVDLAPGGNVFMPDQGLDRVVGNERRKQLGERFVLRRLEGLAFEPFQLDAHREVVALRAAA